jgi:hypothetical protein
MRDTHQSNRQDNGNTQLNGLRNELNDRVSKTHFLGRTARVAWNGSRRFRTI